MAILLLGAGAWIFTLRNYAAFSRLPDSGIPMADVIGDMIRMVGFFF